ncbi:MAG: peptidoglycan-binding protein, partial [Verrucomicrobiia bacterium]
MTPSRSRKHTWGFAVVLLGVLLANPADGAQSSRAFPGPDGSLVYTSDAEGNRIPDFSVAGYQGGGVALPNLPVVANVAPIAGDNTAHLQAAIDAVELRTPDANGFRGALQLAPGDYPISGSLLI